MAAFIPGTRQAIAACICAVLVLAQACKPDDDMPAVEEVNVREYAFADEELWPYFEAYEAAAADRGLDIDLTALRIDAHVVELSENSVAGECTYNPDAPNMLVVDSLTFDAVSERLREYIVFHELGHCERLRKHRELANDDGSCVSIMASGTGECRERFNTSTREELLDELFDEQFYGEWP